MQKTYTLEDIITFLRWQQTEEIKEFNASMKLDIHERCLRGYTISDLMVDGQETSGNIQRLKCEKNFSRFKPGDNILLSCGEIKITAKVVENEEYSIEISGPTLPVNGPWTADRTFTDFSGLVLESLATQNNSKMPPLFNVLFGRGNILQTGLGLQDASLSLSTLQQEAGIKLDQNQTKAFISASKLPQIWGLQGPPGTGKTLLAAMIIEAFTRIPEIRVLVLALSHTAVNNLLGFLKKLFSDRRVVKVGGQIPQNQDIEWCPRRDFIKNRKSPDKSVYGMTVHAALSLKLDNSLKDYHPEILVIDEAGQIPASFGAGLATLGASLILLGDQEQLPAIFPNQLLGNPLACSLLDHFAQKHSFERLQTTHRLNRKLCNAVGKIFYPDPNSHNNTWLQPSSQAAAKHFPSPVKVSCGWLQQALAPEYSHVWLRTIEIGNTQASEFEADVCAKVLSAMLVDLNISIDDIAIVSPFRRQVNFIRNRCRQAIGPSIRIQMIDTVESIQGQSVEATIISLASSNAEYLRQISAFFFSTNRWCVAMSRAKTKVIVIGSSAILKCGPACFDDNHGFAKLTQFLNTAKCINLPPATFTPHFKTQLSHTGGLTSKQEQ